jgi:hypothetical protein
VRGRIRNVSPVGDVKGFASLAVMSANGTSRVPVGLCSVAMAR